MDYTKIQELIRDWDIGVAAVFALLTNYLGIWEFSKHSKEWKAKAEENAAIDRGSAGGPGGEPQMPHCGREDN